MNLMIHFYHEQDYTKQYNNFIITVLLVVHGEQCAHVQTEIERYIRIALYITVKVIGELKYERLSTFKRFIAEHFTRCKILSGDKSRRDGLSPPPPTAPQPPLQPSLIRCQGHRQHNNTIS